MKQGNQQVTITDNQADILKKNIVRIRNFAKDQHENHLRCPVEHILAPTVDKWSVFVLYNLAYNETMRFNMLQKRIKGISSRMLSVTLKKLEKLSMIERKVFAEVPPRVEYSLSAFGRAYSEKLVDLNIWLMDNHANKL